VLEASLLLQINLGNSRPPAQVPAVDRGDADFTYEAFRSIIDPCLRTLGAGAR
jgi:hypothetical protein